MLPSIVHFCFAEILRFGWKIARWDENGFSGFIPLVMTPVGLEEDRVDLGEIDGFGAVSDGFSGGFPLTWCRTQVADAGSAQLVERLVYTEYVGGSSPSSRTT